MEKVQLKFKIRKSREREKEKGRKGRKRKRESYAKTSQKYHKIKYTRQIFQNLQFLN